MRSEATLRANRRYRDKNREMIDAAKDAPCQDCRVKYPPAVMEFDHREGTIKRGDIGRNLSLSPKRILDEIMKCDLVCANCHRIRTTARRAPAKSRAYLRPASSTDRMPPS